MVLLEKAKLYRHMYKIHTPYIAYTTHKHIVYALYCVHISILAQVCDEINSS